MPRLDVRKTCKLLIGGVCVRRESGSRALEPFLEIKTAWHPAGA